MCPLVAAIELVDVKPDARVRQNKSRRRIVKQTMLRIGCFSEDDGLFEKVPSSFVSLEFRFDLDVRFCVWIARHNTEV